MSRKRVKLEVTDAQVLKRQLLRACDQNEHALFLDSNNHNDQYSRFHWLAGYGAHQVLNTDKNSLGQLQELHESNKDWLLGHLSYELRMELENLPCRHEDMLGFPHLQFFVPKILVYKDETGIWLETKSVVSAKDFLSSLPPPVSEDDSPDESVSLTPLTRESDYLETVERLIQELQYGNIYEINYCMEFAARQQLQDPAVAFLELDQHTEAPFAAYYRSNDLYLLCASPERYLCKRDRMIISQPMKGTARRDADPAVDRHLKAELAINEKERSENVMITDLVRNDLSKIARKGSVAVNELFGVYTYRNVHQMLSTVSCEVDDSLKLADLIGATFPMGSMTGAPKYSAMQLIDRHEAFQRGLYSGSVGYITPQGDCDFNVVIRSILYNRSSAYLSARVGSAITIHCNAQKEYEECLLKADSLRRSLQRHSMSAG